MDTFFPDEIARTDAAHPTANSPTSDDSGQASHGPDETDASGGVEHGETTLTDDPEDDDSGTATESLSDEPTPDDSDVDRTVNVKISQPGIAFNFKGKPG